jgi:hypothetical protein
LGHEINTELKTQNGLLQDFEKDVDSSAGMLDKAQARLMHYVSQASNCNLMCLVVSLVVVLVIVLIYI